MAARAKVHYPVFDKEAKRFTPLMLHLAAASVRHTMEEKLASLQAGNMIERPMQVTQLVKEAFDHRFPSTSEAVKIYDLRCFFGASYAGRSGNIGKRSSSVHPCSCQCPVHSCHSISYSCPSFVKARL